MSRSSLYRLLSASAALSGVMVAGAGHAETSKKLQTILEEVVVTAQKRSESLQDVPIAVSAFDAKALKEAGFVDVEDLATQVPNLQISALWATSNPKIFLRGVGNNNFNQTAQSKVAVYLDQVYLSAPSGQLFQMFDLERVEVLRGPQGTLYGKNTTGGAISVISYLPDREFEGYAKAGFGNYDAIHFEGAATLPLSDTLTSRFAISSQKRDGYVTDLGTGDKVNDEDRWAARGILRYTPDEDHDYILNIHGGKSDSTHNNSAHRGLFDLTQLAMGNIVRLSPSQVNDNRGVDLLGYRDANEDPYKNTYGDDTFAEVDILGVSLTANIDFGGGYTFTSVTGYEDSDRHVFQEGNGAPSEIFSIDWGPSDFTQFSQEIRVTSPDDQALRWIMGLFYFEEQGEVNNFYRLTDVAPFLGGIEAFDQFYDQDTDGYAVFGQVSYDLSEQITLTAGLRWSRESREIQHSSFLADADKNPFFTLFDINLDEDWGEWSGRLAIDYKPKEEITLFASVNRGFTAGGFNTGAFNDPIGAERIFDPEILLSYEVGMKSEWFDSRLRLNTTAFFYDYKDLQVFTFTGAGLQFIENASNAEVYGLEIEVQALPMEGLEISAGLGLMESEYIDFVRGSEDLSGNQLIGSPGTQFNSVIQYTLPISTGALVFRGNFTYTGKRYYDETESGDIASDGSDINLDLKISWVSDGDRYEVSVWGKNVTDEETIIDVVDVGLFGYQNVWYNTPRTYGVDFSYHF